MDRRDEEDVRVHHPESDMAATPSANREDLIVRIGVLRTKFSPAVETLRRSVQGNVRIWGCDSRLVSALEHISVADEASPLEDDFATLIRERDGYRRLAEGVIDVRDISVMEEGEIEKLLAEYGDYAPAQEPQKSEPTSPPLPVAHFLANDIASVQSQIDDLDEAARENGRLGPLIERRSRGAMSAFDRVRALAFRLSRHDRERERLGQRRIDLSDELARIPAPEPSSESAAPSKPIIMSPLARAVADRRAQLASGDRVCPNERDRTLVSIGCSPAIRKIVMGDDVPERFYAYHFCRVDSEVRQKARALTRAAADGDLSAGLAIARVMGAEEAKSLIADYRDALSERRSAEALRGAEAHAIRIYDVVALVEKALDGDPSAERREDCRVLLDRLEATSDYLPMERLFQDARAVEKGSPSVPVSGLDA